MTAALEGVSGQQHAPAVLYPREDPLYRRLGGPQGRSERAENLAPPGFDPRTCAARSRYTDWATRPTTEMSTMRISWG